MSPFRQSPSVRFIRTFSPSEDARLGGFVTLGMDIHFYFISMSIIYEYPV